MSVWPFRRRDKGDAGPIPRGFGQVLSLLTPDQVSALGGLPAEAIVGSVEGDTVSVTAVRENPKFVAFMHEVIRTAGPLDPELQAAARAQQDGWVYVIDLRTPEGPAGRVPPEDVIGGFEVRRGTIVEDSYEANPHHRPYTTNGLVQLPPSLMQAFVKQLPHVG